MHKDKPSFREVLKGYAEADSNISAYARAIGKPRRTVSRWVNDAKIEQDLADMRDKLGVVERKNYIITSAQINTDVHEGFLVNLEKMAEIYDAELMAIGITYNVLEEDQSKSMGQARKKVESIYYRRQIRPYLMNDNIRLNKKIEVLGKLNILPTAVNPLSGYQSFTGERSAILPHPKIAFESVPTRPTKLAKFLLTCGSVTMPNFIQKNAGIKGEFHHQLGAVIVEVIDDKQFHLRHVIAEPDGSFYDLTEYYKDGKVSTNNRPDVLVYGDIHTVDLDPVVDEATWGKEGLANFLNPRHQVFHDVLDFKYRNHHNRDNPNFMKLNCNKLVIDEIEEVRDFLKRTKREDCSSWVVKSNHDEAFDRWIKECSAFDEPNLMNAVFLSGMQTFMYHHMIDHRDKIPFDPLQTALVVYNGLEEIHFVSRDESLDINGIEQGMHGDKGLNGARGTVRSFNKIGCKANIGHSHSAHIVEGVYQVGCSRTLNADYTSGPSSWSHTHCIQYANGKRTLITCINGKFYGPRPEALKQLTLDLGEEHAVL